MKCGSVGTIARVEQSLRGTWFKRMKNGFCEMAQFVVFLCSAIPKDVESFATWDI